MPELLDWADGFKRLGVRANADTPEMIAQAIAFGAEGIGLCRTERMFNAPERLSVIREFILAESVQPSARRPSTTCGTSRPATSWPCSGSCKGKPIIIRLLDLPLHEFLPREHEEVKTPASSAASPN